MILFSIFNILFNPQGDTKMKLTESVLKKIIKEEMEELDLGDEQGLPNENEYGKLSDDMVNQVESAKRSIELRFTKLVKDKKVKVKGRIVTLKTAFFSYDDAPMFSGEYYDEKYKRTRNVEIFPFDIDSVE